MSKNRQFHFILCLGLVVGASLAAGASSSLAGDPAGSFPPSNRKELARRILEDKRMDQVTQMGQDLLKSGLNAGSGYAEVWIRDLNTFIVPALDVTPQATIREALLVFFHFQGEDGNIVDGYVPRGKEHVDYKFRTSPTRSQFKAHKNTVETDQESSLVQAVCRYVQVTGDRSILDETIQGKKVSDRLEMALRYPLEHRFVEEYGLIWGATTADWGDVQPEHPWGVELDENSHRTIDIYDNALLLVAIQEFLQTVAPENSEVAKRWQDRQQHLSAAAKKHLWDNRAQKFVAHIYLDGSPFPQAFDEDQVFFHGGTAVAIEAGLLTPHEILISYGQMLANLRLSGAATLGLTLYPTYPKDAFKNPSMVPYGYQNGGDWTWFGARMIRQLAHHGFAEESYRELAPMLDRVIHHQGFHEWWSVDNQPRGSGKFRGSAGVLIEAIDELRAWAEKEASGN